jgi:surface polysaccharide O-acyltransferase-like enzyme
MEEQKPISHFLAGVIIGAVIVVYSLLLNFLGKGQDKTFGWIAYILFVAGIVIFVNLYGNAKSNEVSFGNLFSYGFKTTAISTLLILLCLVVIIFAMPDFKQKILDGMRKGLEDRGKLTDEQIDQSVDMFSRNFMLFVVGGATFMYLLFGVIGSLIGAAITKKKPINPLDQMSI